MERVEKLIRDHNIQYVRMEVEDIQGVSHAFLLDVDHFKDSMKTGVQICQSINSLSINEKDFVEGSGVCVEIDFLNGHLYADLDTFRVVPWLQNTASVLSNFRQKYNDDNSEFVSCNTRSLCKKQIERLTMKGMKLYSAFEFEFYLMDRHTKEPAYQDFSFGLTYHLTKYDQAIKPILSNMKSFDILFERAHPEHGPGQLEISQKPSYGITGMDNAFRFKHLAKEVTTDYAVTFLTKPFYEKSGSSGHYNHSIWSSDSSNLFYDANGSHGLSKLAEHWIAGLQHHSDALTALCCPTSNCYSRIESHNFSPANNAWGLDNRTLGFRVKTLSPSCTYVENRIPGGAVNPYLGTAATVIAGLDGVEKEMKLNSPNCTGDASKTQDPNVKPLPGTLAEALLALEKNKVFVEQLGEEFIRCFCAVKRHDIKYTQNKKMVEYEMEQQVRWYRNNVSEFI